MSPEQKVQLAMIAVEADKETARLQKVGVLVSSITGGLSAASGSTGQILAGTLAPVASYQIGQYFKENATRNDVDGGNRGEEGGASHLLAHSVLGAAIASAGGGSELIGAITAAGAEAAAPALAQFLYGKKSQDLNSEEKSTISAVIGLGGAVLGSFEDGLEGAINSSSIAKNSVENNWGKIGHYSTMSTVLYLAGFSETDAKGVGLAAWAPDTDSRNAMGLVSFVKGILGFGPQHDSHLLDGNEDPKEVIEIQEKLTGEVAKIFMLIKSNEGNPDAKAKILSDPHVQQVLHAFGDSFAHVDASGRHFIGGFGHASKGTSPDNPDENPSGYSKYVAAIYKAASGASGSPRISENYVPLLAKEISSLKSPDNQLAALRTWLNDGYQVNSRSLVDTVGECGALVSCDALPVGSVVNPKIKELYRFNNEVYAPYVRPDINPILEPKKTRPLLIGNGGR